MDRRDFFCTTLASATALTAETEAQAQTAGPKARNVPAFELDEATIAQLGQMQQSGRRIVEVVWDRYG